MTKVRTCHGCRHNWYSAPGGIVGLDYPGRPAILSQPHSRCVKLQTYIPMVLGEHGKWIGSEIPADCPAHAKPVSCPVVPSPAPVSIFTVH